MSVASLELCRELYVLSGWEGTDYYRVIGSSTVIPGPRWDSGKTIPAYDLGYLLRKLDGFDVQLNYSNQWRKWYADADYKEIRGGADTPEDAAARLAVELFKQGVLKREQ